MIRLLRAFAWLRWRLLIHSLRGPSRRDALERVSRAAGTVVPIVLALVAVPAALGLGALSLVGGYLMTGEGPAGIALLAGARILLGAATVAVVIAPVLRPVHGSASNLTRLLLLPIPRHLLHSCNVASNLSDPWILVVLPGILLLPVGLAATGAFQAAALALAAAVLLLAALVSLGSFCGFFVQIIFRDRRRGEALTLALIVIASLVGFAPLLLEASGGPRAPDTHALGNVPVALRVLPSELYARAVADAAGGRGLPTLASLALLGVTGGALYGLSWRFYRWLIETPATFTSRRAGRIVAPRLPGLSSVASAVAWVQIRNVLRTVVGKMAVYFNPVVVLLFGVAAKRLPGRDPLGGLETYEGVLLAAAGVVLTLLSLQRVFLNQFAVDRSGLILQFLSPASDRDLVRGKHAAGGILAGLSVALCMLTAFSMAPGGSPLLWLGVLLGGVSMYSLLGPAMAVLAAAFPRPGDLAKTGSASNPHAAASLIGFLATAILCAPPTALMLTGLWLGNAGTALVLVAGWTLLALALAIPLGRFAAGVLGRRRENLALVAQGR